MDRMVTASQLKIVQAADPQWDGLQRLFGRAGAENGCWCQYWLIGANYHRRDRNENATDLRAQVGAGRAGLLALAGDEPVGWARLTNRSELTYLTERFGRYEFSDDDPLSLACFFIQRRSRGAGCDDCPDPGRHARGRQT